jgi:hypothetical protein
LLFLDLPVIGSGFLNIFISGQLGYLSAVAGDDYFFSGGQTQIFSQIIF